MGKSFEEYWEESKWAIIDYPDLDIDLTIRGNYDALKQVVKMVWEDSRQNMTTRDI